MSVRVKDNGAKRVVKELATASKHKVKVGVIGGGGYEDGISVAEVAEIHEFGLGSVPQRSWLRAWIDENKEELRRVCTALQKQVIKGAIDERTAHMRLGAWVEGKIKARISAGIDPPLAPATIARKGSSKPLIDTGQLRSSITHQVE